MTLRPERYDDMRRAWIASHQGWSTIQRRRAELLGRKVRARQRAVARAVPDPHDDTVIPPLWLRAAQSPASQVEMLIVVVCAVIAPLGWLVGWALKSVVTRLIPGTLRAFPIAALLWAGAVLGAVILFSSSSRTIRQHHSGKPCWHRGSACRWRRFRWPPVCTALPKGGCHPWVDAVVAVDAGEAPDHR